MLSVGILVSTASAQNAASGNAASDQEQPLVAATATSVDANHDLLPLDPHRTDWKIQIEPLMWYLSPSGDIRLPARSGTGGPSGGGFPDSGSSVKIADLNLDSPQFSPAGEVHLSIDRWRFTFSGAAYSLDRDQTTADENFRLGAMPVSIGDGLSVNFEFATAELTLGYNVYSRDLIHATDPARQNLATPFSVRLYLLGGARIYDTDISVRNITTGQSASADEFFIEPILGARGELSILDFLTLDLQVSGGYFSDSDASSSSLDIAVGFHYHPTDWIGVQIGWRQILFNLSDGNGLNEFEYSGALAGLYTGLTLRF